MADMPQEQKIVEVRMLDGRKWVGIATGNNAAWLCICGYQFPLLGRTGKDTPTIANVVNCPECNRFYHPYPENGTKHDRVEYVQECEQP